MHWGLPYSKAMLVSTQPVACGPPYAFSVSLRLNFQFWLRVDVV
jgi:hypothetical protein